MTIQLNTSEQSYDEAATVGSAEPSIGICGSSLEMHRKDFFDVLVLI